MTAPMPLRLWPGVAAAALVGVFWYVVPVVAPDEAVLVGMVIGAAGVLAIVLWWLFFSRARWLERIGALVLMAFAVTATRPLVDKSIAGGMMGNMLYVQAIPLLSLALVAWAAITRWSSDVPRRIALVIAVVLACAPLTLIRTAGVIGAGSELRWRWTPTPEDRLLAKAEEELVSPPASTSTAAPAQTARTSHAAEAPAAATLEGAPAPVVVESKAEWPGFRGPGRDGIVRGVRIGTDWTSSPPVALWRRPIGPGWSSFAIQSDLLYTQEQRGEDEIVAAYRLSTGQPVWRHRDHVRFWESNGGAGPRATPTLANGRVYAFGATGVINALDARTGAVIWSRNAATDTHRHVPDWGFAGSPLVIDDIVVVAVSGTLAAYDAGTGKPRWVGPQHGGSYSSPQQTTIDGVSQVLLLSGYGATSVAAASGATLWEHEWSGSTIVQPAVVAEGDIVINTATATGGVGTRRLTVKRAGNGWHVEERWTSNGLKPYFNDFVIHKGHALGFDGSILACIDLETGQRKWKGGRYGNGQLMLLAEQDLLLVVSEEGDLALVSAAPDRFTELATFKALDGKTWNHPALVRDVLLLRNGEEMAAFRMPAERR